MSEHGNLDIWQMLFDQTPVAIRYLLTVLTLGIFGLVSLVYHRLEKSQNQLESRLDKHMQETNNLLLKIVENTNNRNQR